METKWALLVSYVLRESVVRAFERLKWFLWHGNVYRAFQVVELVEMDLAMLCRIHGQPGDQ
jgi:hypothetical protein